ncbi:beta-glucoside-specific PTS transporter subunit IIABC [Tetragenococcus halophilus]|uniref:beta-glucoside-specific PTS transporter subunit IIABC n=1 Tax=Tetragenococcus halophilus TaxID=51669 RepID=UPI0015C14397|nr:beta-glucoside-specific PTS transporter subunit IIABC [Tetragenococcus halophilus]NWO01196.1 PTS transporter subunit EIIC [Tetragenococcus halophilus]
MKNSKYKHSIDQIVKSVGGETNIRNVYHCATRLRFQLNDVNKFDEKMAQNVEGVLGTKITGDEAQFVIGGEVGNYYSTVINNYNVSERDDSTSKNVKEGNIFKRIVENIVGVMSPIIIALIGFGLIRAVLALLTLFGLSEESLNYQIINMIGDAGFYFLPMLIAASAARQFKTNQYLAIGLTGILLHPTFQSLVESDISLEIFGLPIREAEYGGSVIPIILIVWVMSYVDRLAEKVIPSILKTMLKPLMIIAIMAPLTLIILGPIGAILGDGLFYIMDYLRVNIPWLVPTLMGTFTPLLVMVGMHPALTPIAQVSFSTAGFEIVQGPGMLASNISQAGATLGVFFKSKDKKMKQIALSSSITALSGITEPALYGVNLKLRKPLIYVMISGGIAGFYAGLSGLVRYSFGSPGLLTLPVFFGEDYMNIIHAIVTLLIGFGLSFVLTLIFGFDESIEPIEEAEDDKIKNDSTVLGNEESSVYSFVEGNLIPIHEVNDEIFSTEKIGPGIAIRPTSAEFKSPVTGAITSVFPSKHAIGLKDDNGLEMLLHIGIDTVKLDGQGFKVFVKEGDRVDQGDVIANIDIEFIENKGFDVTSVLVFTNNRNEPVFVSNDENDALAYVI